MSSPRLQKYFCFLPRQISSLIRPVSFRQRGVAHVINVGRDAVDAAARETNAVCLRTAKSCGSDAPIVGVKSAIRSAGDGVKKRGHRGEREVSRKTIARGMPGRSGVTVVTMLVCLFYFAYEAAGALRARHSLRPLIFRGANVLAKPRAHRAARSRRHIAIRHPCVTASPLSLEVRALASLEG